MNLISPTDIWLCVKERIRAEVEQERYLMNQPFKKQDERWEELKRWLKISQDAAYAYRGPWTTYVCVLEKMKELEEK